MIVLRPFGESQRDTVTLIMLRPFGQGQRDTVTLIVLRPFGQCQRDTVTLIVLEPFGQGQRGTVRIGAGKSPMSRPIPTHSPRHGPKTNRRPVPEAATGCGSKVFVQVGSNQSCNKRRPPSGRNELATQRAERDEHQWHTAKTTQYSDRAKRANVQRRPDRSCRPLLDPSYGFLGHPAGTAVGLAGTCTRFSFSTRFQPGPFECPSNGQKVRRKWCGRALRALPKAIRNVFRPPPEHSEICGRG